MQTNTFHHRKKEEYKNYKKEQEKKAKEAEITRLNNGIRLECKQEIEKQIAEKYNGFSVPQNTVSEIVEKYGIDCVKFVLANTIVQAWKEGRFSLRNKEWASSILTEGEWSNTLILNTHPTILDGFTNQVRNLQHEKKQVVQEQLTLDGNLCILVDQWESGNVKYLIGNCVDDPDFYYVQCANRVFEFDRKPDRVEVEDYYIDILAEEDIDRHEAEVDAKLDGEELQRLSWQVVHEADDAFGNPTKWSARLFSDVFLWINKGNAVYSIYDAEGYPPLETFESLEDAMHGPMNLLQMEETLKILFQTKRRQIPKKNKKKVKLHRIKVQLPIFRSVMTIWGKDLQKRNSEGILLPLCCLTGSNRKTDTLQQKNSRFSVNILDGVDWRMPLTKANQTGLKNISN